jgi:ribosomal protein L44E
MPDTDIRSWLPDFWQPDDGRERSKSLLFVNTDRRPQQEEFLMAGARIYVGFDCMKCDRVADIPQADIEAVAEMGLTFDVYCSKCNKGFEITLEQAQWLKDKDLELISNCKDCGDLFAIAPEEAVWLLENNLKLFRRCPDCREKNKEKAAKKAEQLELEVTTDAK